ELYLTSNTSTPLVTIVGPLTRAAVIFSICAAAYGCNQAAATGKAEALRRVQPTYDKSTGKLTKLSYDSNANGKHDTWAFMDGARIVRLEADENEDGQIDRWEHYPAADTASIKQVPERIDRSTHSDGKVSRREFFEAGALVRIEEDVDGNGAADKWETYVSGALATLALDTAGRGTADRRFIYRPDGSLDRIEADPSGSGQFQPVKQ
ncbi:MAG: hypothetical protein ABIP65_09920, partial [Vicinamibacterales bacterium]